MIIYLYYKLWENLYNISKNFRNEIILLIILYCKQYYIANNIVWLNVNLSC